MPRLVGTLPPVLDAPGRPEALAAICLRHAIRRLDLFGSAATGAFDPTRSDVDVLVEWDPNGPRRPWGGYEALRAELEALFERPVDLVAGPPERLTNPYFRQALQETVRPLFVRDAA